MVQNTLAWREKLGHKQNFAPLSSYIFSQQITLCTAWLSFYQLSPVYQTINPYKFTGERQAMCQYRRKITRS